MWTNRNRHASVWLFWLLIPLLGTMYGCSPTVQTTSTNNPSSYRVLPQDVSADKHMLLGFTLIENADSDSVFLHFSQVNAGRIVEDPAYEEINSGDVRLDFISGEGEVQKTIRVQDPTKRSIETFSEAGELETSVEQEQRAEFYIRFNMITGLQSVRVFRVKQSGSEQFIQTIPLTIQ